MVARDGQDGEAERDADATATTSRVAQHPGVVVQADELDLVGSAQVEVGEAEVRAPGAIGSNVNRTNPTIHGEMKA